jgi:hypothetical protein
VQREECEIRQISLRLGGQFGGLRLFLEPHTSRDLKSRVGEIKRDGDAFDPIFEMNLRGCASGAYPPPMADLPMGRVSLSYLPGEVQRFSRRRYTQQLVSHRSEIT